MCSVYFKGLVLSSVYGVFPGLVLPSVYGVFLGVGIDLWLNVYSVFKVASVA